MWERRIDRGELFSEKLIIGEYALFFTDDCPKEKRSRIIANTSKQKLNWLEFLETFTERQIYINSQIGVVVKRKIYTPEKKLIAHPQRSVVNEIRASNSLNWAVKWMEPSMCEILDEKTILNLSVEKPYGAIINLDDGTRYVMFEKYEGDSGEILHRYDSEPPIEGNPFFNPYKWELWCCIADEIDRVAKFVKGFGIVVGDWHVHQTMYRHDKSGHILDIHLIDADCHELEK